MAWPIVVASQLHRRALLTRFGRSVSLMLSGTTACMGQKMTPQDVSGRDRSTTAHDGEGSTYRRLKRRSQSG